MANKKIKFIIFLGFLLILIVGLSMYAYVNIFKFKKIEYTNKGGATYSLKYYKDYQTISLS